MAINTKRIGVLNLYTFPKGMAATSRILAYCKGLQQNGVECKIISFMPKSRKFGEGKLSGTINQCDYYHFAFSPKNSQHRITLLLHSLEYRIMNLYCKFAAVYKVYSLNQEKEFDYMILSFDSLSQLYFFVPVLRLFHIRCVAIADEYPRPIRDYLKTSVPKWKLILYKIIYNFIDGRVLMTEKLQKFYDENISAKPTLILSSIVDTDRFLSVQASDHESDYLCYMGNMALSKDNVDNIIRAFAIIRNDYPHLKLLLYGTPSDKDRQIVQNIIDDLHLQGNCRICGRADYNEVPQILASAKILLTSQPNTKRAEGGFPTKMGEYFMSSVPAILTDVGEISEYVTDGVNGYIVEPESPVAYAQKIRYVLENYDTAIDVAKNARIYVLDNFSTDAAGKSMLNFFKELSE